MGGLHLRVDRLEIQQGPSRLFKDGSGAGFKVGKVKLHFEVHGLA